MQLLKHKSSLIYDDNYNLSLDQSLNDYFNRSLSFSQTNYNESLKLNSILKFNYLSPPIFINEYCVVICNFMEVNNFEPLHYNLVKIYNKLYDTSKVLATDLDIKEINYTQKEAIIQTINIVKNGLNLYGWTHYKDNYLSSSKKLMSLPLIYEDNSKSLYSSIGRQSINEIRLKNLAIHFKFNNVSDMCAEIYKSVYMPMHIIENVLWYAANAFDEIKEII